MLRIRINVLSLQVLHFKETKNNVMKVVSFLTLRRMEEKVGVKKVDYSLH